MLVSCERNTIQTAMISIKQESREIKLPVLMKHYLKCLMLMSVIINTQQKEKPTIVEKAEHHQK